MKRKKKDDESINMNNVYVRIYIRGYVLYVIIRHAINCV
jgi:hypothetical protein